MKKSIMLGSVLAGAMVAAPVMADDLHALSKVSASPAPLTDNELSAVEGGWYWGVRTSYETNNSSIYISQKNFTIGSAFVVNGNTAFVHVSQEN